MVDMPVYNMCPSHKQNETQKLGKENKTKKSLVNNAHLISEDNSAIRIIFARMNPRICREENGACIKTMNYNLHQVELLAMKIGNKHCPRIPEIEGNSEISCVFNNMLIIWWLWYPAPHRSLYTLPWIGFYKNNRAEKLIWLLMQVLACK